VEEYQGLQGSKDSMDQRRGVVVVVWVMGAMTSCSSFLFTSITALLAEFFMLYVQVL